MYISVIGGYKRGRETVIEGCLSEVLDIPEVIFFETDLKDLDLVSSNIKNLYSLHEEVIVIPMMTTKENYAVYKEIFPNVPTAEPFFDCEERDYSPVSYFMENLPRTIETAKFYAGVFVLRAEKEKEKKDRK